MPSSTRSGRVLQLTAPEAYNIDDQMDTEAPTQVIITTEDPANVNSTALVDCNGSTVTTLAPIPQYDFGSILEQLPGAVNITNLEVTLQQQQFFHMDTSLSQMQTMVGNTEQMVMALKEHVNYSFREGNNAIRNLCNSLGQTFSELTSNHSQIFQAMQSFVSQFKAIHGDVTTNRAQLLTAATQRQELHESVGIVQAAGNNLQSRVDDMGGQLKKVQAWIASQEVEMCFKLAEQQSNLQKTISSMELQLGDQQMQLFVLKQKSTEEASVDVIQEAITRVDQVVAETQDKVAKLFEKVCMYEAQSTQVQPISPEAIQQLRAEMEDKLQGMTATWDKRFNKVVGATTRTAESMEQRNCTIVGLANQVERVRQRVCDVEKLRGNTDVCKAISELQATSPTQPTCTQVEMPPSQPATQPEDAQLTQETQVEAPQPVNDAQGGVQSLVGAPQTEEEEILARQVELVAAREAAKKAIASRTRLQAQQHTRRASPTTTRSPTQPTQVIPQKKQHPQAQAATQPPQQPSSQPPLQGFQVVQHRRKKAATTPDRSCWLYVSNYTNRRTKYGEYRAPGGDPIKHLMGELGCQAHILVNCQRIASLKGDKRLIINAPNKATRRKLLGAIKSLHNRVRARPFLTPQEKANKSSMYKYVSGMYVKIEDMGDRCILTDNTGSGNSKQVVIDMDNSEAYIKQQLNQLRPRFPPHITLTHTSHRRQHTPHIHQPTRRPPTSRISHLKHIISHQHPHTYRQQPPRQQPAPVQQWRPRVHHPVLSPPLPPQLPPALPQPPPPPPPPTYLSNQEVLQLKKFLAFSPANLQTYPTPPPPSHAVNVPASAQLAWALGVHPTVHRQGPWGYP